MRADAPTSRLTGGTGRSASDFSAGFDRQDAVARDPTAAIL
jgi:hypothetical protein